jgi:DNA-binding GntR family transcriptional regulator
VIPATVQRAVADDLRDAILRGRLAAGTRLNQNTIASQYGVSPIPIREALIQLESEGLVKSAPHRGAVVASLSKDELRDLYDIRIALESLAAQLAALQAGNEDVTRLEALLARMDKESDPTRWLDLNLEFHRALYAPSRRSHLCSLIDTLRRNTERYLRIYAKSMGRLKTAQEEHRRILHAYRQRDAISAAAALREHLQNTLSGLLALLAESPALGPDSGEESRGAEQRRRRYVRTVDE